jgi:hypothetical protein
VIDIATLTRAQKDRLVECLLWALPDRLAYDLAGEPAELAALTPVPTPDDYYVVKDADVAELLAHTDVAITISSSRPTTYPSRLTGTRRQASALTRSYVTITAHLRGPAAYATLLRRERQLREREILELMVDIYRGAVLSACLEHAIDGSTILEIAPISDYSEALGTTPDGGARGRATIELELSSHVHHPTPAYTLTREAP